MYTDVALHQDQHSNHYCISFPGVEAIMECLESSQPEIAQAVIDKLPEIVVGMQEHAALLLMRVFELGVKSRLPVEAGLARSVAALNLLRGC